MSNYTKLVFQGGSVKGIAYTGALEVFDKEYGLDKVTAAAGTSAGAITALLVALGYSMPELSKLVAEFNFKDLLDDGKGHVSTSGPVLKAAGSSGGVLGLFAKTPAKTKKPVLKYRLMSNWGIYKGDFFRQWAEERIRERVSAVTGGEQTGENLSFGELHDLAQKYPTEFKDLYVVGANLSLGQAVTFSYENADFRNAIVSDAVRISMSIPYLFQPHILHYKGDDGERFADPNEHIWVDGGLLDNYPIGTFDTRDTDGVHVNNEVLGFRLVRGEMRDFFLDLDDAPETPIAGLLPFSKAILTSMSTKQESDHRQRPGDIARTVYVDHLNVSTLAFDIPEERQEALIGSGRAAMGKYISGEDTYQSEAAGAGADSDHTHIALGGAAGAGAGK